MKSEFEINEIPADKPIVLFDGYCHLCDGSVSLLLKLDWNERLLFTPLQSKTGTLILNEHPEFQRIDSILLFYKGQLISKADAVFTICSFLPFHLRFLTYGRYLPSFVKDNIYDLIAANRYRIFGKRETCRAPTENERSRFLK